MFYSEVNEYLECKPSPVR